MPIRYQQTVNNMLQNIYKILKILLAYLKSVFV